MGEKLYILSENGQVLGLENRQVVHEQGILHLAVQCWIMNDAGMVLIQRRSATKDKSAGKWDVSFGGHCVATDKNQDILTTNVIKEGKEELGIDIQTEELIKLGEVRYTSQGNKNRELLGVFLLKVSDTQQFVFEDGEVSEVKWIKPDKLYQNMKNNPVEYANRLGALILLKRYTELL